MHPYHIVKLIVMTLPVFGEGKYIYKILWQSLRNHPDKWPPTVSGYFVYEYCLLQYAIWVYSNTVSNFFSYFYKK